MCADLEAEWAEDDHSFPAKAQGRTQRVSAKAWRFAGEMREIADTFAQAGLPDGFHSAAAEIYDRLSSFKEQTSVPELDAVLAKLRNSGP